MESTPGAPAATGHTKQYVFVDEYNRHKRLKVMRACDGCRKRKIRCDGALQNGPWPCGACQRLKLKCVPPTLDPDDEQQASHTTGPGQISFQATSFSSTPIQPKTAPPLTQKHQEWQTGINLPAQPSGTPQALDGQMYAPQYYTPQHLPSYADGDYLAGLGQYQQRIQSTFLRSHTEGSQGGTEASGSSGGDPKEVDATVKELSTQMGELSIDINSSLPFIANERKTLAETPAVEEVEVLLPASVGTDTTVRIPPEMMLDEDRAADYFGYFFSFIYPYVPVINRSHFYEQWRSARHSISPLLLEGIFACVARYLDKPIEVRRWLALAARHEESFKDVPRLSTIQAMILLTKAREFVPKRGYYYRSWMAVKYMTTMACDLGLDEHYENHRGLNRCKLSKSDCLVRTRIWHTLFNLEILVGAPQARTDFAVDIDTLDFAEPTPSLEVDAFELSTSRRFTYLAQCFRNIKVTNNLWQGLKKIKDDWALDPAFVRHNEDLFVWVRGLPPDIQITYPGDGGAPYIGGDHFVTYIHVYHHLVVIMHYRPQLQAMLEKRDPNFKDPLEVCLKSAAYMCRLQEALVRDFGLHGLQFMQRGINFSIYCVLTCMMLHLAAITSPDPALNADARMYFTRHMRVLEQCIINASPEMQVQINALQEAFSNDTSKPFELKPTLGLRSPSVEHQSTPPEIRAVPSSSSMQSTATWASMQGGDTSKTISPASEYVQPFDHVAVTGQQGLAYPSRSFQTSPQDQYAHSFQNVTSTSASQTGYGLEPVISNDQQPTPVWDPSQIFQQWNSAFGAPQPPPAATPVTNPVTYPTSAPQMSQQNSPVSQQSMYAPQQMSGNPGQLVPEPVISAMPVVSPAMWQDAFTTAYVSGHGNKRFRQEDPYNQYSKRRG
ncbi:hypothetical protein EJ03DRAFT_213114 [Teratosphaeria nubilosa]|uniref:Zn(2)-C6 fungal-type domain-containing protein n=1 Tax=Teratosphaeria nubilosa TaxID=161662 RepID=A0A6G1LHQ4_9PEZI|nr:hypothetical protein EJ03DRAFT_213114 [Teratosphaeria nubilosa]